MKPFMANSPSLEAAATFGALAAGGAESSAAREEGRNAVSKNKKEPFERATLTDSIERKIKGEGKEFKWRRKAVLRRLRTALQMGRIVLGYWPAMGILKKHCQPL
jgi:hypothetical protein